MREVRRQEWGQLVAALAVLRVRSCMRPFNAFRASEINVIKEVGLVLRLMLRKLRSLLSL